MSDIDEKQLVLYAQMASLVNLILQWPEINIKEIAENFSKVFWLTNCMHWYFYATSVISYYITYNKNYVFSRTWRVKTTKFHISNDPAENFCISTRVLIEHKVFEKFWDARKTYNFGPRGNVRLLIKYMKKLIWCKWTSCSFTNPSYVALFCLAIVLLFQTNC